MSQQYLHKDFFKIFKTIYQIIHDILCVINYWVVKKLINLFNKSYR